MPDDLSSIPPDLAAFLRDELGDVRDIAPQRFIAEGEVWIWTGTGKDGEPSKGVWYFLTVTGDTAALIRNASAGRSGGWGSVKVSITIGKTNWNTSLFPSQSAGGYLLPLKAAVRKAEKFGEGDRIRAEIFIV